MRNDYHNPYQRDHKADRPKFSAKKYSSPPLPISPNWCYIVPVVTIKTISINITMPILTSQSPLFRLRIAQRRDKAD
ncbi:hypothetical protein DC077_10075 [Ignatzschineria cameli]|uniref:Uncharacterized protein n=1 Tax=Ignatzschineria cameli TaxID=2182793 RepID=A0A2U2AKB7_9GAMM|nr:hypothetical protein DC077_10075 [Ignatzschineria cameli]